MAFNIGAIVSVNGEPEFNQAMRNMGQNLKYVNAEANSVMSTFGQNEKSVASLTARNGELRKALDIQKTGIKSIQSEMERLIAAGLDPASEKYKQLKANLDNTTAAANKTEREIKDNEQAMADLNKGGTGLGDMLNGLTGKLGINLPQGAKESLNSMANLNTSMLSVVAVAAAVGAAIYKVVDALADLTIEQAKAADDLLAMSVVTGISVEKLQELQYASGLVDTELSTITQSMGKMTNTMDSARKGTEDTAEAYKRLGVRITDNHGQLRDSEVVFWEVIDALGRISNATERDALAMDIMGRSARDLNPLIATGSQGMQEYAKQAREMGFVSEENQKKLGALDDQMMIYNGTIDAAKKNLAASLAPALTDFMKTAESVIGSISKALSESGIDVLFSSILELVSSLAPAFETLFGIVGPGIGNVLKPLALALGVVADALNIVISSLAIVIEAVKWLFGNAGSEQKIQQYWGNMSSVFSNNGATARAFSSAYIPQANKTTSYASTSMAGASGAVLVQPKNKVTVYNQVPYGGGTNFTEDANNPLHYTRNGLDFYKQSGGDTFNVTIDAKNVREFNDIVKMAQSARQTRRAGGR